MPPLSEYIFSFFFVCRALAFEVTFPKSVRCAAPPRGARKVAVHDVISRPFRVQSVGGRTRRLNSLPASWNKHFSIFLLLFSLSLSLSFSLASFHFVIGAFGRHKVTSGSGDQHSLGLRRFLSLGLGSSHTVYKTRTKKSSKRWVLDVMF